METFKFPLLQQLIFPPHQTFHITTPLELDFGSVQGLVLGEMTADAFLEMESKQGNISTVVTNKLQCQNPTPEWHLIEQKHNKF